MKKLFILLIALASILSCNQNKMPDKIAALENSIAKSKELKNIDSLFLEYKKIGTDTTIDEVNKVRILEHGADFMTKYNNGLAGDLLIYLLKEFPDSDSQKNIKSLIAIYDENGDKELANLAKSLYIDKFPDDTKFKEKFGKSEEVVNFNFDKFIRDNNEKIYSIIQKNGQFDLISTKKYINACTILALIIPKDERAAILLYNAAQIAQMVKLNKRAIELYDWIYSKYPQSEKTSNALFMKAFILDSELKNYDEAKKCYQEFLDKFPSSPLAKDAATSLEYLGLSDEEILEKIELSNSK